MPAATPRRRHAKIGAGTLALSRSSCFSWPASGHAIPPLASVYILKALDYKFRNAAAAKNQCHREVPLASEACLSGAEILTQLDRRLGRLRCVAELDAALRHL